MELRCASSSPRLQSSSAIWPLMHSREPMRPSRQSASSASQPGRPKRTSNESVTSSTEIVPSKSQITLQRGTLLSIRRGVLLNPKRATGNPGRASSAARREHDQFEPPLAVAECAIAGHPSVQVVTKRSLAVPVSPERPYIRNDRVRPLLVPTTRGRESTGHVSPAVSSLNLAPSLRSALKTGLQRLYGRQSHMTA